jgi:hypothetical protein
MNESIARRFSLDRDLLVAAQPSIAVRRPAVRPDIVASPAVNISPSLIIPPRIVAQPRPEIPPATTPAAPLPEATNETIFDKLPFPQAGERIRAEDFRALSQALTVIADSVALASALLGQTYGQARMALTARKYVVERVLTIFGAELTDPNSASLDDRTVLAVAPVKLGDLRVNVVLSEAVDTRRMVPNLLGLTYAEANERMRLLAGDAAGGPIPAPQMVGLTLDEAAGRA